MLKIFTTYLNQVLKKKDSFPLIRIHILNLITFCYISHTILLLISLKNKKKEKNNGVIKMYIFTVSGFSISHAEKKRKELQANRQISENFVFC